MDAPLRKIPDTPLRNVRANIVQSIRAYRVQDLPGFVLVLDQIPTTPKFDKEVREQLLDSFRDAAEYWAERKIPFRCFYSFL
jgi:hypothetical protein